MAEPSFSMAPLARKARLGRDGRSLHSKPQDWTFFPSPPGPHPRQAGKELKTQLPDVSVQICRRCQAHALQTPGQSLVNRKDPSNARTRKGSERSELRVRQSSFFLTRRGGCADHFHYSWQCQWPSFGGLSSGCWLLHLLSTDLPDLPICKLPRLCRLSQSTACNQKSPKPPRL